MNDKFIVQDATDIMVIGGFGNLQGNLGLLKYSEKEIAVMIKENNNENETINLVNSLLKSIKELKEQLQQREDIINKAKEYNNQIIKDTKEFYRPTSDLIYSGDCLIDLAEQNIKILDNKGE